MSDKDRARALGVVVTRRLAGRLQKDVAAKAEFAASTLSKIKNGHHKPHDKTFNKLARGLDVPAEELRAEQEEEFQAIVAAEAARTAKPADTPTRRLERLREYFVKEVGEILEGMRRPDPAV